MASINERILKIVEQSLETDVLRTVQAIQRDNIKKHVYAVYYPNLYDRRKQNGGLMDIKNIVGELDTNGNNARLSVSNITEFNREYDAYTWTYNADGSEYLTPLIVYGHEGHRAMGGSGYTVATYGAEYMYPRNFVSATRHQLKHSNAHVNSLKKSLKKKGIEVS